MEKFILINGLDNYAVSNYGNIKNVKTGRILTPQVNKQGYLTYTFYQHGIKKSLRIHRLVGFYFVPNPDNKPYINHKDGDKTNNHAENLEWCTAKENDHHARESGLKEQEKTVAATELISGETLVFKSVTEAGAVLGINTGTICKVLKGRRNQTHGYSFSYLQQI